MLGIRLSAGLVALSLFWVSALAQPSMPVDWSALADPEAQQFEDPYRELSKSQFESLMALARTQVALGGDLSESERENITLRASELSHDLHSQGLEPEWILSQREVVAERRQRAALSTNPALEGESIELTGYLLVAPDMDDGEMVAYLLPDRGVCMHLPPPAPNQLVRLDIDKLPEPLGPCIAAAVRGRISANETTAEVPVFDDTVSLWSRWSLNVSEATTLGNLSAEDAKLDDRVTRQEKY